MFTNHQDINWLPADVTTRDRALYSNERRRGERERERERERDVMVINKQLHIVVDADYTTEYRFRGSNYHC